MRSVIASFLALVFLGSTAASKSTVTLFVAVFDTPAVGGPSIGAIGKRVSTILSLQVWQNLRKAPYPNPRKLDFGHGGVTWDMNASPPKSYAEAEILAGNQADPDKPQLVMWGRAWEYGTGIVVEPYLSIRRDGPGDLLGKDIWKVTLSRRARQYYISVDVPEWRYEFGPIVLQSAILPELVEPGGLKLYADSQGKHSIGYLGEYFKRIGDSENYAHVLVPGGTTGWVHLPGLSANRSEVVDFCGGMIQLFRHDWNEALRLLSKVVNRKPLAPTSIRIDAYLYMALAANMTGNSTQSLEYIEQAYGLNPYRKTTIQYLCLNYFTRIRGNASNSNRTIEQIRQLLRDNESLFPANDRWISHVRATLDVISR